jgi:transketolase
MRARCLLPPEHDDSTLDVLEVLHTRVLRPGDHFLLSKGHNPMAFYAVLAATGQLDPALLETYGGWDSSLGHHPDRTLVPGATVSSGSLGHGLPIAVGLALGLRAQQLAGRVVCLLGDGELDEGSNAEAVQYAGRAALSALTAVVVDNQSASLGWPGASASASPARGGRPGRSTGTIRTRSPQP